MGNRNSKILWGVVVSFAMMVLGIGIIGYRSGKANAQERKKVVSIEDVKARPSVPMIVDNSDQPPLFIYSAEGKVIDGDEYQRLTDAKPEASRYITFPNVRLINNSDVKIVRFSVYMKSRLVDEAHTLRFHDARITSGAEFLIQSKDWAGPRAKSQTKFAEKEGAFVRANRSLDFDSDAMWMPGDVQDYSIGVLSVEFEDGKKWVAKRW